MKSDGTNVKRLTTAPGYDGGPFFSPDGKRIIYRHFTPDGKTDEVMSVGFVLLESLPPYEGGPGNGKWNLGQYVVPRASDLPLHELEVEVLPPVDADERPKGMAEVVMMPVAPALINAIYDATGHRFQSLPVTQAMIKGALK